MSNKKKIETNAWLVLPFPVGPATTVINGCLQQVATVVANPDITNHPEVKAAATVVQTKAQSVGTTLTSLGNAHATVTTLETQRDQGLADLRYAHHNLESVLNVASAGNPASVAAWGGKVATRNASAVSTDAPTNVSAAPTTTMGSVLVKCKADRTAVCYLMQTGADPAHPETWAPPTVATGAKHVFSGLTVGQKAYFRVAIVRRGSVQGAWSGVVDTVVR